MLIPVHFITFISCVGLLNLVRQTVPLTLIIGSSPPLTSLTRRYNRIRPDSRLVHPQTSHHTHIHACKYTFTARFSQETAYKKMSPTSKFFFLALFALVCATMTVAQDQLDGTPSTAPSLSKDAFLHRPTNFCFSCTDAVPTAEPDGE